MPFLIWRSDIFCCTWVIITIFVELGQLNLLNVTATDAEKASVEEVNTLYKDFISPVRNADIIDSTWTTCGHNSNVAVGCITELYMGVVLDPAVSARCCRERQWASDCN